MLARRIHSPPPTASGGFDFRRAPASPASEQSRRILLLESQSSVFATADQPYSSAAISCNPPNRLDRWHGLSLGRSFHGIILDRGLIEGLRYMVAVPGHVRKDLDGNHFCSSDL